LRLFVAIDLDGAARAAIAAEQKRIAAALRERSSSILKWVRGEHMHLTLVFLGEVDEARVQQICEVVSEPVPQAPFELTLGGIGMFPPRGRPAVLWVGAAGGAVQTIAMQRALQHRVERLGFAAEARVFHPHLTLARWRESRDRDRGIVAAVASEHVLARVSVDHATLYRSRLGSGGPTYTALSRATLTA